MSAHWPLCDLVMAVWRVHVRFMWWSMQSAGLKGQAAGRVIMLMMHWPSIEEMSPQGRTFIGRGSINKLFSMTNLVWEPWGSLTSSINCSLFETNNSVLYVTTVTVEWWGDRKLLMLRQLSLYLCVRLFSISTSSVHLIENLILQMYLFINQSLYNFIIQSSDN